MIGIETLIVIVAMVSYLVLIAVTYGKVLYILSHDSNAKINHQKWYIDIIIALLISICLPIIFVIFFFSDDSSHYQTKRIIFKFKRPKLDELLWQEVDLTSLNGIWPKINNQMIKYLGV